MYVPQPFAWRDADEIAAFLDRFAFATLISTDADDVPYASHLPLIFARGAPHGTLRGHLAKANPQCAHLGDQTLLAIFQGPHCYVSPDWYESAGQVPTWNYLAVHATGRSRVLSDDGEVAALLADLAAVHEGAREDLGGAPPWTPAKLDPDAAAKLRGAVVAFEITIERLEAKAKLGQNRAAEDRRGAAAALARSSDPSAREIGALMAALDQD